MTTMTDPGVEVMPATTPLVVLAVPGTATRTGLALPEGLSVDEWASYGPRLTMVADSVNFWLGDWWAYGDRRYGESAAQAAPTGRSVQTLQNAAWVCGKIEPSRRREGLSFGHHAEVAGLEPERQDALLADAEREGWSVGELRGRVRGIKQPGGFGSAPDEWAAPAAVVEAAERLAPIDLAPCGPLSAPESGQEAPGAAVERREALSTLWHGFVFLHPPYDRDLGAWVDKLIAEHTAGRVPEAVALLPARTDTAWFRSLRDFLVCTLRREAGPAQGHVTQPGLAVYLGGRPDVFVSIFSELGDVWTRVSP